MSSNRTVAEPLVKEHGRHQSYHLRLTAQASPFLVWLSG